MDQGIKDEHLRLIEQLEHRGPDGNNFYLDEEQNIALVHSRLSIIDLKGGLQPMSNAAKTKWITYNGELYNFQSIRGELSGEGYVFRTSSDTEVILAAYEKWGKGCLCKFRGMFAFCILDYDTRELFLARDHFGIKPLYYYLDNRVFAFSSELYGLTDIGLHLSYNFRAIDSYLGLQYIPGTETAYSEIKKMGPAQSLSIGFDLKTVREETYWEFNYSQSLILSTGEWMERVEAALEDSVQAHLVSDVPYGAFLSGGIDSTLIATYMTKVLRRSIKTFTIGFEDNAYSETKYASRVAKQLGAEHYFEIIKPDALEILPSLVKHYGEPFGDSSAIPTYYVSKLAREHVPMVLSGDGSDEAFLGYQSYSKWNSFNQYQNVTNFKRPFHPFLSMISPVRYPPRNSYHGWIEINRYMPYSLRKELWKGDLQKYAVWNNPEFDSLFARMDDQGIIRQAQYADLKTYLPNDILTKVDRASMMHGLEVRTPFVDIEIWKLISGMPVDVNLDVRNGSGKNILKNLLRKHYPEDFVSRPKQGFSIPLTDWLSTPKMKQRMQSLYDSNSGLLDFFNGSAIRKVVESKNGKYSWLLLVLDEWLKSCKEKRK